MLLNWWLERYMLFMWLHRCERHGMRARERREMLYLNHIADAKCMFACVCSYQMNWIGSAIYNEVILFLSIAHCPVRETTMSVSVYEIPTIIHFLIWNSSVRHILHSVCCCCCSLSTLQCNVSFTCQKRLLFVFVTWCDRCVDQPNEFMLHQMSSTP